MSEHQSLIEQARAEHEVCPCEFCEEVQRCRRCAMPWPCLTARLTEAMEEHRSCATFLEDYEIQLSLAREDLERAEARAERLARVAAAAQDWETLWSGGRVAGKTLSDVCEELAGATAALGLAGGEEE